MLTMDEVAPFHCTLLWDHSECSRKRSWVCKRAYKKPRVLTPSNWNAIYISYLLTWLFGLRGDSRIDIFSQVTWLFGLRGDSRIDMFSQVTWLFGLRGGGEIPLSNPDCWNQASQDEKCLWRYESHRPALWTISQYADSTLLELQTCPGYSSRYHIAM